ncbi:genetic competence negative regulator [Paenibacillus chartarius]|uniref:Adapter protein MecA n=1 Tax=Paenibacillus chartarius TaxID=747481 RepID=A0ABV6DQF8_9BACL
MKIERLSQDKIRIFLTFDDLTERGIQKDDMWREIPKVHELFGEMMDQAYTELGFDPSGPLAVEVFALPAQGMVVIVTRGKMDLQSYTHEDYEDEAEEMYEMEVTLEQSDEIAYAFRDFEDLLCVAKIINPLLIDGGTLYSYKNRYILRLEPIDMEEQRYQTLIAVLSEYGEATSITDAVLDEYGNKIISDDAVKVLCRYFQS